MAGLLDYRIVSEPARTLANLVANDRTAANLTAGYRLGSDVADRVRQEQMRQAMRGAIDPATGQVDNAKLMAAIANDPKTFAALYPDLQKNEMNRQAIAAVQQALGGGGSGTPPEGAPATDQSGRPLPYNPKAMPLYMLGGITGNPGYGKIGDVLNYGPQQDYAKSNELVPFYDPNTKTLRQAPRWQVEGMGRGPSQAPLGGPPTPSDGASPPALGGAPPQPAGAAPPTAAGEPAPSAGAGSRSWRNNNPLNIRSGDYASSQGATGQDGGGFAVFPDAATGMRAAENLLFEGKNYRDLTLPQAIVRWAPAGDGNDPRAYIAHVVSQVGALNKPLRDYTPEERNRVLTAMRQFEGWVPGAGQPQRQLQPQAQPPTQTATPTGTVPQAVPQVVPQAVPQAVPQPAPQAAAGGVGWATGPSDEEKQQREIALAQRRSDIEAQRQRQLAIEEDQRRQVQGQETAQRNLTFGTQQESNKAWITNVFTPLQQKAQILPQQRANLDALEKLNTAGITGPGAELKDTARRFFVGMGLAPDTVRDKSATLADLQALSLESVNNTLMQAKGVQTEGDAQRARALFPSLDKTQEANQFLIDYQRAGLERAQKQYEFYRENIPKYRDDPSQIDGLWLNSKDGQASIWDSPSMAKWKDKFDAAGNPKPAAGQATGQAPAATNPAAPAQGQGKTFTQSQLETLAIERKLSVDAVRKNLESRGYRYAQ